MNRERALAPKAARDWSVAAGTHNQRAAGGRPSRFEHNYCRPLAHKLGRHTALCDEQKRTNRNAVLDWKERVEDEKCKVARAKYHNRNDRRSFFDEEEVDCEIAEEDVSN